MSAHTNENDDIAMCSNGIANTANTDTANTDIEQRTSTDIAVQNFMQDEEAIRFSLFVKHDAPIPSNFQIVKYDYMILRLTIYELTFTHEKTYMCH